MVNRRESSFLFPFFFPSFPSTFLRLDRSGLSNAERVIKKSEQLKKKKKTPRERETKGEKLHRLFLFACFIGRGWFQSEDQRSNCEAGHQCGQLQIWPSLVEQHACLPLSHFETTRSTKDLFKRGNHEAIRQPLVNLTCRNWLEALSGKTVY